MTGHTPPAAETNGQLIVALAIVAALTVIGIGLLVVGVKSGNWVAISGAVGTIIGALATALNAPTGIASVLRAGKPKEGE
jgi:hypothetical protein